MSRSAQQSHFVYYGFKPHGECYVFGVRSWNTEYRMPITFQFSDIHVLVDYDILLEVAFPTCRPELETVIAEIVPPPGGMQFLYQVRLGPDGETPNTPARKAVLDEIERLSHVYQQAVMMAVVEFGGNATGNPRFQETVFERLLLAVKLQHELVRVIDRPGMEEIMGQSQDQPQRLPLPDWPSRNLDLQAEKDLRDFIDSLIDSITNNKPNNHEYST